MDPRLACQQGTDDDLTKHLGYGSDTVIPQEMWAYGDYYPMEGGDVYHMTPSYAPQGGGGGGPPGSRGGPPMTSMSIAPMQQPSQQQGPSGPAPTSTPPADMNKALHMQGQGQMPQGGQLQMSFPVGNAPRPAGPNFYQTRTTTPRMPTRNPAMFNVTGNGQQIVPGQTMTSHIPYPVPVYVGGSQVPISAYQNTSRINSSVPPAYFTNQQQPMYFNPAGNMPAVYYNIPVRSGPAAPVNITGPPQSQQGVQPQAQHGPTPGQVPLMSVQHNMMQGVSTPAQTAGSAGQIQGHSKRRKNALPILDPVSGRNVVEDMEKETSASGGSSNRETPQPESLPNHDVAVEFAERVSKAATEDSPPSAPSAPTQPPDIAQPPSSVNGPAPPEHSSEPSLSQPSFVEEPSSIVNPWSKGVGHKGPSDIGDKPHEAPPVYFYPSTVISAKNMDLVGSEMYASNAPLMNMPAMPLMMHTMPSSMVGPGPGRPGGLSNSLAMNDQTPVVSANTNAPSVPVEVYREPYPAIPRSAPQQAGAGSAHQGSHPSPQRRKRQDNNTVTAAPTVSSVPAPAENNSSQLIEGKPAKKGSPTPSTNQSPQGTAAAPTPAPAVTPSPAPQPKSGAGGQKDGKREKNRDRASTPKESAKEVTREVEKPTQQEKPAAVSPAPSQPASAPAPTPAPSSKGKTSSPSSLPASTPSVDKPPQISTPSPTPSPTPAATQESKPEKPSGGRSRQASSDSLTESDGKASGRNKGKKMRDSNNKGAEKESSDVETLAELAVAEEPVSTPATTPTVTPTPPASETAAVPVSAPTIVSKSASPTPATTVLAPETPVSQPSQTAAAPAQPTPAAVAPKAATEPAPAASQATAPPPVISNPMSGSFNMFTPTFATGPTPTLTSTKPTTVPSNKRVQDDVKDDDADKEDRIVAARNEENSKVSGMKKDPPPLEKRRTYTADQWSPSNPEGKKKYDRNFLMDLRSDPQSQKKPDGLPDMDVVLKESNKRTMSNTFSSDFSPAGLNRSSGSRGVPMRKSQQGKPKPGKPQVIHMSISLREDVKLHETENAWKPGILASNKDTSEEEAKTQDLYKRVRGVLNKLTPEKFDKLVSQVQALPIDTPERLDGVINLVFDKAVDEPNFSVAYAKLCNELRTKEVTADEQSLSFRKILVSRCQREFEKNKAAEFNKDAKLKEIEAETDPEKKKELTAVYEEEERRVRMKSVGNVRFIGELYKLGMLTPAIMHRCIVDLLGKREEESLECLCKLLTTIGKKLEGDSGGQGLTQYFNQMRDLADKKGKGKKISSRVRFMLQDVIDLQNNHWVPRRDDSNPKTMEQIQKEAERESIEIAVALCSQPNTPRKDDRMSGRGMGSMEKRGGRGGNQDGEGGWKTATRSSRTNYPVDTGKLKTSVGGEPSLGSPNLFSKWGTGSATKEMPKRSVMSSNPYQALQQEYNKPGVLSSSSMDRRPLLQTTQERNMGDTFKTPQDPGDRGSGSRSSSRHRISSQPSSRDSSIARGERDDDRKSRVPTPTLAASQNDDSVTKGPAGDTEAAPVAKLKRLKDPDEIARSSQNIVLEFLGHKDLKEALLSVQDYFDWSNITDFARESMMYLSERTQGHGLLGRLFNLLKQEKLLRLEDLLKVLTEVISMGDDLAIDVPKVWTHIAGFIAPLLVGGTITFKDLASATEELKGTPSSGVLLSNIVQILVKDKGPSWIRDHWKAHGVNWTDFLAESDVEDFVKKNDFESFSGGMQASGREGGDVGTKMTQTEIQAKLLELIRPDPQTNATTKFEDIQEWINANVGEKNTSEPYFIRALMTAIVESSLKEIPGTPGTPSKWIFHLERLEQQEKLLMRYVDSKAELELQCLYAIQALIHKLEHPQGIILNIFNFLWEKSCISSEAFIAWFKSQDPHESAGKSVCLLSLRSFECMISEADNDEEDDES